jgi:chromosome segregation ATPase
MFISPIAVSRIIFLKLMKHIYTIGILLLFSLANAQDTDSTVNAKVTRVQATIEKLSSQVRSQQWNIDNLKSQKRKLEESLYQQEVSIDSLKDRLQTSESNISQIAQNLGTEIQQTGDVANSRISELYSSNRLYWIIATLATLLLGGLLYWLLGKRISSSKTDVETQIRNTKSALEEESVKLDSKLVEVLTKQLEVIKTEQPKGDIKKEDDHSLVLKVADRLTAMETNHYRMDPKTKGLKSLMRAVKSIKENYLANGYEIVEMIGQEYKEGLNVTANFIPSEDIEPGKQIITMIIKPQVNYKDKIIQAAEIQVSVGE